MEKIYRVGCVCPLQCKLFGHGCEFKKGARFFDTEYEVSDYCKKIKSKCSNLDMCIEVTEYTGNIVDANHFL